MTARFEIVHTDAAQPWHARFIAANGEPVWSTETYVDERDALGAVQVIVAAIAGPITGGGMRAKESELADPHHPFYYSMGQRHTPLIHFVDERAEATST